MEVLQTSPLGLLGTAPKRHASISKTVKACQRETEFPRSPGCSGRSDRKARLSRHQTDRGFAEEPGGLLGGRRADIEAGAPLESRHLGELGNNLEMPVVVIVIFIAH